MSSNKRIKEEMIKRYGEKCFIEALKIRNTKGIRYTGKKQYKRMKMLTYHHILEKHKGGKASIENGAILSAENHIWFHKQSKNSQKIMNDMFQEYKEAIDKGLIEECEIIVSENVPRIANINLATIKPREFNRAKEKRKTQELIDEYYKGEQR